MRTFTPVVLVVLVVLGGCAGGGGPANVNYSDYPAPPPAPEFGDAELTINVRLVDGGHAHRIWVKTDRDGDPETVADTNGIELDLNSDGTYGTGTLTGLVAGEHHLVLCIQHIGQSEDDVMPWQEGVFDTDEEEVNITIDYDA